MANDPTAPSSDAEVGSRSPGQGDGPPAHLHLAESNRDSTPRRSDLEARAGGVEGSLLLKHPADEEAERSAGDGRNVGTQELAARIDALEKRLAAGWGPQPGTVNSLPPTPEAPAPRRGDGEAGLRLHISALSAKLIRTQQQLEELQSSRGRRRHAKRRSSKRSWWRRLVLR